MKKQILSIVSLLITSFAFAQTWVNDSVSTGVSYANDVYYNMNTGTTGSSANNNWHIAFQMAPQFGPSSSASILANHAVNNVQVFSLNLSATAKFATLSASDTVGKTNPERELVGSNKTWNIGAFNRNKDQSNLFDYGWGKYNQTTNNLSGDSIYLVKVGTTTAYKIWVQEYVSHPADSIAWKVRIATFSGGSDTTLIIPRNKAPYNFTDRLFAYVNLGTYTILDREPSKSNWDLVFTRYKDTATQMGLTLTMNVSGVLQHPNVSVAEVPNAAMPSLANLNFIDSINTIGYDWKYFPGSYPYIVSNTNYFVKNKLSNLYYVLQFTAFGGSANGLYSFKKQSLGTTSISNTNTHNNTVLSYPNPAAQSLSLLIDAKENMEHAKISICSLTGSVLYAAEVSIQAGMNTFTINTADFANGLYLLQTNLMNEVQQQKICIQH
ncbi:MAG: T9SS type A sorting domain-containing protein [Bacteroidota bacterium]|nr:T9SS type A sorting domain-containing protein [Bacteroidota bacterium]